MMMEEHRSEVFSNINSLLNKETSHQHSLRGDGKREGRTQEYQNEMSLKSLRPNQHCLTNNIYLEEGREKGVRRLDKEISHPYTERKQETEKDMQKEKKNSRRRLKGE